MSAPAAKPRTKSLPGTPRPARSSSDNRDREDNQPSTPSDEPHSGWNWHAEGSPSLQVSDAAHGEGSSIIEESDVELEDSPTTSSVCPGSTPPDSQRRRRRISSASVGQTSSPSPTHTQQEQQQQTQMLFKEGDHKSDNVVPRQEESSPFDPGLFDWSEETAPPAPLLPARPLFPTTFLLPVPQDAPQSLASSRQHPHRYHPARMNYDFCLFIANLPPAYQEDHLRRVVKEHFAPFGQIQLVKVKREDEHRRWGRGDCWGWVWFDNEASALKALEQAPLTPLLGRVIRVERAKAHRSLLLEPTKGYRLVHRGNSGRWLIVPEGEEDNMESEALDVEELVHRFGRIEEITERAPLVGNSDVQPGEPRSVHRALGIDIKFEHRDDGITALNTLRARTPQIIISWSHDPPFHSAFPPARLQPLSRAYPSSEPSRPFAPPGGVATRSPRPFEGGVSVPGSRGAGGGGGGGRSGPRGSTWGVRGRGGGGGGLRRGGGRGGGPRRIPGRPNAVEDVDKASSTSAASATGEGYEVGDGSGVDVTQDDEAKCNSSEESDDCSGNEKHKNRARAQLEVEWPALSPNKPLRLVPGLKSKSASPAPIITDLPVDLEVAFHPRSRSTEPASPRTPPNRSPLHFSAEAFTAPQPVTKFSRQPPPQVSTPSLTGVSTSEDYDTGSLPSKRRPDDGKMSAPSAFETPSRPPRAHLEDANRSLELETTPALSLAGGWSPVTPIVVPTPPASLAFAPSAVSAARLVEAGPGSGAGLTGSKEDVLVDPNAIFVGGLEKKEVDERNLRDKFSPYGVITDLHYVPNAPKTQTGFAFITYASANSAQEAVKNEHGSLFFGNKIRVQLREVPNEHLGHFRRVSREYGAFLSTPTQGMSSPETSPTRSKPPEAYLTKRPSVPGTRGDGGVHPPPLPAPTAPPFLQLPPQIALSGHHHQHPMLMAGYPMGWYPPPYYPPAFASSPLPPHLVSEVVSAQQTPGSAHPPAGQPGGFIASPEQQQQQMMYYPPWMYHMPPHFYSYPPTGYVYSPAFAPSTREDTSAPDTKPDGGDSLSNAVAKTTTMPAAATIETVTSSSTTTTAGGSPSSSPVSYSSVMRYPRSATRPASSSVRQGGNGNGNGNGSNGEQRHGKTKGLQQRGEQTERIQRQGRTPSRQQQQHQPRTMPSTGPEVAAAPFYISQPPPPPPVLSASQAQQQQQATSQLPYGRLFQPRGPQHDYIAAAQQQLHAWSSAVGGGTTWPRYEPQQPSFPQQTVAATTTTAGRIDQLAQPPYYESSSVGQSGGGSRSTPATPLQQHAQQGAQGQPTPSHLSTAAPFYYPPPSQQNQYLSSYELAPLAPPPPPPVLPSAPAIPASSGDGIAPRRPVSSSIAPAAADIPYPGGGQSLFQTDPSMIGPLYGGDLGGARYS